MNAANSIAIKTSIRLIGLIVFMHLGGMLCIVFLTIPKIIIVVSIGFIGISLCRTLWTVASLQETKSIIKIVAVNTEENIWQLLTKSQKMVQGSLRKDTYCAKNIIFLRINIPERRMPVSVILCVDAVEKNDWRRLQVMLRNFRFVSEV
jgi:hypothetical protein